MMQNFVQNDYYPESWWEWFIGVCLVLAIVGGFMAIMLIVHYVGGLLSIEGDLLNLIGVIGVVLCATLIISWVCELK
jgi:hypothetical protein